MKVKRVVGRIIRNESICQKSDDEIIRLALYSKARQLERVLEKRGLSGNERKALQDEYERTFALTERFGR